MPEYNSQTAWSGAFISWVMRTAASPRRPFPVSLTFPYSANHFDYAQKIKESTTSTPYPFEVLNPFPEGSLIEFKVGDIVVKTRNGGRFIQFSTNPWPSDGEGHGDIVVSDTSFTGMGRKMLVGGNLGNRVQKVPITETYLKQAVVVLRPLYPYHAAEISRLAFQEWQLWNTLIKPDTDDSKRKIRDYFFAAGWVPGNDTPTNGVSLGLEYAVNKGGITPFIESLESFHPKIQYELTRRRISAETANVYMPFVKLTSLSEVQKENLSDGTPVAYCPSLGIHGEDSKSFEDIYSTQSNKSIIAYAYAISNGNVASVPVLVENSSADAKNIPIPGITKLSVERGTAGPMGVRGGLMKADVKIVAYSVGQVDTLLRYYLRPATRLVLELGRMSSNQTHPNERLTPFDWKTLVKKGKKELTQYFGDLIKTPETQEEFIKEYIYKNCGNYEVFIAYVVKFNLKYNKNNTFEIDLTLHSVQQFEVPTKHTAVQSICPSPTGACKPMDILEYFSDAYSWKDNSFTGLLQYYDNIEFWKTQFIAIKNNNTTSPNITNGAASTQAGTRENEYFVTWDFFVEKILNDSQYGIASMLGNPEVAKLALLRVTNEPPPESTDAGLIANQVGYHPNLRSVNPEVMIINNPTAQRLFNRPSNPDAARLTSLKTLATFDTDTITNARKENADIKAKLNTETLSTRFASSTPFANIKEETSDVAGSSFINRGVWLNTKAIKQAFTSTDTISAGISMLLNMMNSATEGYWNLQLYSTDVKNPGMHIIDMGLSKEPKILTQSPTNGIDQEENESTNILNSIGGVNLERYYDESEDKPKYIYMFNRGTKRVNDGELGSDLIDLNVEFNMPQVIAVQAIANIGGPAQKSTLQSINIEDLKRITLINDLYTECNNSDICQDEASCESDAIQVARSDLNRAIEREEAARRDAATTTATARNMSPEDAMTLEIIQASGDSPLMRARADRVAAELSLADIEISQFNPNLIGKIREYADLGTAIELIEINPARMMKELNKDSTNAEDGRVPATAHAFNSSNLTKTVVDITLPGIGGINLFQAFLVDRVPSIIERGFYVVTKINHEFSPESGWTTKIQGRFRFRPKKEGASRPYDPCIGGEPLDLQNLTSAERDAYRRGGLVRLEQLRTRGF